MRRTVWRRVGAEAGVLETICRARTSAAGGRIRRRARPVDARQLEVGGLAPRQRLGLLVVVTAARVASVHPVGRRILAVAACGGQSAAVGEDAAGRLLAEVRQEARDRVQAAVVLPHA